MGGLRLGEEEGAGHSVLVLADREEGVFWLVDNGTWFKVRGPFRSKEELLETVLAAASEEERLGPLRGEPRHLWVIGFALPARLPQGGVEQLEREYKSGGWFEIWSEGG